MEKVLVLGPFNNTMQQELREQIPSDRFVLDFAGEIHLQQLEEADYVILRTLSLGQSEIEHLHKAKLIQRWGAGFDTVDIQAAGHMGIQVAVTAGMNATPVSEMALALMLAVYRNLVPMTEEVMDGGWTREQYSKCSFTICGKTVGIYGIGNIGKKVAALVRAFGAKVIYYDPFRLSPEQEQALDITYVSEKDLLAQSNILTLHAPYTPQTAHFINKDSIARMKPSAVLINTARAELVDYAALAQALREKRLLGAGLDAIDENAATGGLFAGLHNVVLTEHLGGNTVDNAHYMAQRIGQHILAVSQGQRLEKPHLVNGDYLSALRSEGEAAPKPQTIAEKILSQKSGAPAYAGDIVFCQIDQMMAHDANGPLAIRAFQSMGGTQLHDPDKVHFIMDHATPPPNERIANLQQMMRTFAKEQGVDFVEGGEGVCHQIMMERGYVHPGDLVIGTDSHTCTYGAAGAFATGVGATDMGVALLTGVNWFRVPQTIKINLVGTLPGNCTAKDIILYIIGTMTASGGNYLAFEFYGDYLDQCTMADRMTIANMVVEMGGKAGFLCHKGLGISADPEAKYLRQLDIDLSQIAPGAAKPHTVDNYTSVESLVGTPFQFAFLGSCTNGRIEDLRQAAEILRGKHIAPGVRLMVIPASKTVMLQAAKEGIVADLMEAGAFFFTPGCGACVGTHGGILADGEVAISTANRNFKGRMGNNKGFIYLVSPKTLAVSCLHGTITLPE